MVPHSTKNLRPMQATLFIYPLEQILTSVILLHMTQILPLNKSVREALDKYFEQLEGHSVTNLYDLVLEEIESPLFASVMKYTKNNQSNAATILGISRGTLRKKIKQYKIEN